MRRYVSVADSPPFRADGTDHADSEMLVADWQHRRLAYWSVLFHMIAFILAASFVSLGNFSVFRFGAFFYGGIFFC
jgi:hypothetical protein